MAEHAVQRQACTQAHHSWDPVWDIEVLRAGSWKANNLVPIDAASLGQMDEEIEVFQLH